MPVHRLDHINLRASGSGFAALREFYCRILGLRIGERPPLQSEGLWLYAGETPVVHLLEAADGSGPPAAAAAAPGTAFDHVAFGCSGLEEMLGRVCRLGVPSEVRVQAAAGQVLVRVEDPSGLRVELVFAAGEETARRLRCWGL
jgi:catechol 2,3-dioxygenase-like lactoylglutathione lyase family enzyme